MAEQELQNTVLFLAGKSEVLINQLIAKMEAFASALDFEQAACYRDQIVLLCTVLEKNFVHGERGDVDILACATKRGTTCIQVFFIRGRPPAFRQ